jgi:hypothetical protein
MVREGIPVIGGEPCRADLPAHCRHRCLDRCLRGESDTECELAVWEYQHAESEGPLDIGKPRKTCVRSSPKLGPLSTDEIGLW